MSYITDPKFLIGLAIGWFILPRVAKPIMDKVRGALPSGS